MDNLDIQKYADNIFGYCIKRLNNIDDAQDLSQEILLEIIKTLHRNDIKNFDAWIWKIAHNRYVHFINKKNIPIVSLDDSGILETLIQDSTALNDCVDKSVEINAAFCAIHSITKSHRDILIDFYISELSYEQISQKHNLPINTVKTRLFYGKQKLKERWQIKMCENKVYNRINWFICGNGDVNPFQYLNRQMPRAILTACYQKSLSVDEISLATGIPCLYIEDELSSLLQGEIITCKSNKYRTNIIIHSATLTKQIESMFKGIRTTLADKLVVQFDKYDREFREIHFLGSDRPNSELWWFLIPIVLREACEQARRKNGKVVRPDFPPRLDGGMGWIFVNEIDSETQPYFSGCNGYYRENNIFTYYWSTKYFNNEINKYLAKLEFAPDLEADGSIDNLDEVLLAEGIKYNIIKKVDGYYTWNIAVFTKEQMNKLNILKTKIAASISNDLLPAVNELYEMYLADTPKHLNEQIKGVFGAELNTIISMVCEYLEEKGILDSAEYEYFTKQIIMTLK